MKGAALSGSLSSTDLGPSSLTFLLPGKILQTPWEGKWARSTGERLLGPFPSLRSGPPAPSKGLGSRKGVQSLNNSDWIFRVRGVQIWCPQDCPLQPPASYTQLVLLPGSSLSALPRAPSCPKATGTGPGEGWRGGWSHQEPPHPCPSSARLVLLPIIHVGKTETQRESIIYLSQ